MSCDTGVRTPTNELKQLDWSTGLPITLTGWNNLCSTSRGKGGKGESEQSHSHMYTPACPGSKMRTVSSARKKERMTRRVESTGLSDTMRARKRSTSLSISSWRTKSRGGGFPFGMQFASESSSPPNPFHGGISRSTACAPFRCGHAGVKSSARTSRCEPLEFTS